MNNITLVGRICDQPTYKEEKHKQLKLKVITIERYLSSGEEKQITSYHNIECWGSVAELNKGLLKNDMVSLTGSSRSKSYDDNDGVKRYWHFVKATTLSKIDLRNDAGQQYAEDEIGF